MASYSTDAELLGEPTLDEIFAEPIVQLVMRRDGVEAHAMRGELDRVQRAYDAMLLAV
ncbi:MAG: hypothetical protein ACKVOE_05925 [Rickettsiales bacterium]